MIDRGDRSARVAPWLTGLFIALPVLAFRYPPMPDLPFHESIISILLHMHDRSYFPEGLYVVSLGQPNQLFHYVGWALAHAVPTDVAAKLIKAAVSVAIASGASRYAAHLRVTRWTAVLVAPVALGWTFLWGLIGNLVGFALLLHAIPGLDDFSRAPSRARALRVIAWTAVLYLAHESVMVIFAVIAAIFAVGFARSLRELIVRLVPTFAATALGVCYALRAPALTAPSVSGIPNMWVVARSYWSRIPAIPSAVFGGQPAAVLVIAWGLVIGALAIMIAGRGAPRSRDVHEQSLGLIARWRFELAALACLAGYFIMPFSLNGLTLIYHRFMMPAYAFGVMATASRARVVRAPIPARVLAVALPVTMVVTNLSTFASAARRCQELDVLMPLIDRGSAVAQIDLTPTRQTGTAAVPGIASRVLAERGGRMLFTFTDAPTTPAKIPPALQWNESVLRIVENQTHFRPAHDFRLYRYALVRLADQPPGAVDYMKRAFAPEGELVSVSGEWLLFRSTLPTIPIDSPEPPTGAGEREMLADRFAAMNAGAR